VTTAVTKNRVNTLVDRCKVACDAMNTTYQNSHTFNLYVDVKQLDHANRRMEELEERRLKQGPLQRLVTTVKAWRFLRSYSDPRGHLQNFRGELV
jgi:hypothetical protein